ncbi:MAG: hypothetical protein U9O18_04840, partial [Chloroflexota bacterium]|nr:hypothetical protein [Chloroflexota bacterium]
MTEAPPRRLGSGAILNLGIIVIGIIAIVGMLIVGLVSGEEVPPEPIDLAVQLEVVAEGLDSPVLLVGAGDDS